MAYPAGPSYSIAARVRILRRPGALALVAATMGEQDGLVGAVPVVKVRKDYVVRDFDAYAGDDAHEQQISSALVFPGMRRGALNVRARKIDSAMKMAATLAKAALAGGAA